MVTLLLFSSSCSKGELHVDTRLKFVGNLHARVNIRISILMRCCIRVRVETSNLNTYQLNFRR